MSIDYSPTPTGLPEEIDLRSRRVERAPNDTDGLRVDRETLAQLQKERNLAVRGLYLSHLEDDLQLSQRELNDIYDTYSSGNDDVVAALSTHDESSQVIYEGEDDDFSTRDALRMIKARRAFEQYDTQDAKKLLRHAIGELATNDANGSSLAEVNLADELVSSSSSSDETLADYASFLARVEYQESRHEGDAEKLQRINEIARKALAIYKFSYSQTNDPHTLTKIDSLYGQLTSDYNNNNPKNANWSLSGDRPEEPPFTPEHETTDDLAIAHTMTPLPKQEEPILRQAA